MEATLKELHKHKEQVLSLPASGITGKLIKDSEEDLDEIGKRMSTEDFYKYGVDFNTSLTNIKNRVRDAVLEMSQNQKINIKDLADDSIKITEWQELNMEEQNNMLSKLEEINSEFTTDLNEFKKSGKSRKSAF